MPGTFPQAEIDNTYNNFLFTNIFKCISSHPNLNTDILLASFSNTNLLPWIKNLQYDTYKLLLHLDFANKPKLKSTSTHNFMKLLTALNPNHNYFNSRIGHAVLKMSRELSCTQYKCYNFQLNITLSDWIHIASNNWGISSNLATQLCNMEYKLYSFNLKIHFIYPQLYYQLSSYFCFPIHLFYLCSGKQYTYHTKTPT